MIKGLDHVGILVRSLDEAVQIYQNLFSAKTGKVETTADQGVKSVLVDIGSAGKLQILEPLPESSMAKLLEKRGGGLHHICFEVDNIEQELDSLANKGVELINKKAHLALGVKFAFVHPKSAGGILVELCQKVQGGN